MPSSPTIRPPSGQVGARDELHEVVEAAVGVRDEVAGGADDLDEVVRRHVGREADGDAGDAVDEQVGVGRRQHAGLQQLVVVVRDEVDGVLVEARRHGQRGRGEAGLGVAGGGGPVVERAEVAVAVDERQPHRERLRHPHEGVVDRGVTVRVVLAHDVADDAGGLHVPAVGAQAHLAHRVEDPALHRLEAVAHVGQGPRVDDRHGVLEERVLHLEPDVDVDDVAVGDLCGLVGGVVVVRLAMGRRSTSVKSVPRGRVRERSLHLHSRLRRPRPRRAEPPEVQHLTQRSPPALQ